MLREDLRHGLRRIRRRPAFAAAVALLLALGIATATTVFSLVEAVLLNPLPYPSPDRLVMVWETMDGRSGGPTMAVAPRWFPRWHDQARSFEAMAAASLGWEVRFQAGGEPDEVVVGKATSDLFRVLGARAALGRTLLALDDLPGAPPVAVLSDSLWKKSFGAEPGVLGRTVELDGQAHVVVGVMPPGFDLMTSMPEMPGMDVWTPLRPGSLDQGVHSLYVVARLAEGVRREQAQAEMDTIMAAIKVSEPAVVHGVRVMSLHEEVVGRSELLVFMLFGASAFVLLIVCANAGGLMVAKTSARESELAVRASLGASRGTLIRQLLAENLILAALGGLVGVLFATAGLEILRATIPADVPRAREMALDGSVLAFSAGATLFAVVLLALAPAVATSGLEIADKLRQGSGVSARAGRSRRLLIVAQLALTLVLAHGAALMLTSYAKLTRTDMGFDPNVLAARLATGGPGYESPERVVALAHDVVRRTAAEPAVANAAVTDALPLYSAPRWRMRVEGHGDAWDGNDGPYVGRFMVTPDYFDTVGMSLVAGRLLSRADVSSGVPVAVVNQAAAKRMWPGEDPIGRRFGLGGRKDWITVVGVVSDVRHFDPERPAMLATYVPLALVPAYDWVPQMEILSLVVRGPGALESLAATVRQAIRSVDASQPVADVSTLGQRLYAAGERRRFNTVVITTFATLGTLLVVAGIYALLSSFVVRRRRDIGIRMALGAGSPGVLRLVLGHATWLLIAGIGCGLAAVFALDRLIAGLLYAVSPTEPAVLAGGIAFVTFVALAGSLVPALQATRVDPASVLRGESL